ncbi:glutamate cyclase domain-containing protein [Porticoccus sp.]
MNVDADLLLSQRIEQLLVERNLRGMADLRAHLKPGYCLRAAQLLRDCRGPALIGTGFPVLDTFETDGPAGAIALYRVLEALGSEPVLVCGEQLANALAGDYRVEAMPLGPVPGLIDKVKEVVGRIDPELLISIELPGRAADGRYYNMRGEDISEHCFCFDDFLSVLACPSVAIGDGGNEIGMGNVVGGLAGLDIIPAATCCDELVIADVSNWAAHGLVAMLSYWSGEDYLARWDNRLVLEYLAVRGSVDGVTRENTLSEDGLPCESGKLLVEALQQLVAEARSAP